MHRNQHILCEMDRLGYLFPEYRLCRKDGIPIPVGSGSYATVYDMAAKTQTEARYVCKVIGFGNENAPSKRFGEIVRLQQALCAESPNVVRILDAKELLVLADEAGNIIRVLPWTGESVNGGIHLQLVLMEKLSDIIRQERGRPPVLVQEKLREEKEVLVLARQIADALRLAHERNIMHRDVKLENIFQDPAEERYKLGDFGISRYMEEGTAKTVAKTDGYGAPEIMDGNYRNYDKTVDIYSLGITMFLLLNDLKFPGSDSYRVNMSQYNPNFAFPAPAHASKRVAEIIQKMCSFDSAGRYRSMEEVIRALDRAAGAGRQADADIRHAERSCAEDRINSGRKAADGTEDETETFRQAQKTEESRREAEDETEKFRQAQKTEESLREADDETETFRQVKKEENRQETEDETETFRQARKAEESRRKPDDETETFFQAKKAEESRRKSNGETGTFHHVEENRQAENLRQKAGKPESTGESAAADETLRTDTDMTRTESSDTGNAAPAASEAGIYLSRAERRREERRNRERWKVSSRRYFMLLTVLLVPFFCGMQPYSEDMLCLEYVLLPAIFLAEPIFLSIHELYLTGGIFAAGFFYCSVRAVGFTVPHAVLLCGIFTVTPAVLAAGAVSTGLWLLLRYFGVGGAVLYLQEHDVCWIFLIFILLALYGVLTAKIRTEQIGRKTGTRLVVSFITVISLVTLAGVILTVREEFFGIPATEFVGRLHLARTGFAALFVAGLTAGEYIPENENEKLV